MYARHSFPPFASVEVLGVFNEVWVEDSVSDLILKLNSFKSAFVVVSKLRIRTTVVYMEFSYSKRSLCKY
jgi:hypothetical protein